MSFNDLFSKEADMKKAAKEAKNEGSQVAQTKNKDATDDQTKKSED